MRIREYGKTSVRRALVFLFVLAFFGLNSNSVKILHAQGPESTPTPTIGDSPRIPSGANCSSPTVFDDQWGNGFRLVCQNNLYVLMVDLTNPAVRAEVKAASSGVQSVSSFADGNTIAVINADYQWSGCSGQICSQGLTISNGSNPTQYTNITHLCTDGWVRREIGLSQDSRPQVNWWYKFVSDGQARSWCGNLPNGDSGGGSEYYSYNLVGAGPQFTFDGTFRWECGYGYKGTPGASDCNSSGSDVVINGEHFGSSATNWWNRYQSAIGFSTDGTVLVLAESNNQTHTMRDVHDIMYQRLSAYGKTLKDAFKFDGGSKAGMYYYNSSYDSTSYVTVPNVVRIQRTNSTCYSVSTNVNPGGAGNININTPSNCAQGKYTPGTNVQLIANANSGYTFSGWSGCDSTTGNVCYVTMNSNRNVTANFSVNPVCYSLTTNVSPGGSGSVNASPGSNCGSQYTAGTNVQLTAIASSGYSFSNWSGDASGSSNPTTVTMNGDKNITANFTQSPPPKPDLRPFTPSGYSYPVVPSSIQGTHSVNTLYAGARTFFDWHFINSGGSTAGSFSVELWVDGQRYIRYPYSNFASGQSGGFDDWAETILTSGVHTVRLIVDPDNTVDESDESNNIWEGQFTWQTINGWKGEYFNNPNLEGNPWLTRDDSVIDFDWLDGAPDPSIPADGFSARWTRTVNFSAGSYRFNVFHDDGVRLFIDGTKILENWCDNCRQTDTVDWTLTAGNHAVVMEMWENSGWAGARLTWENLITCYSLTTSVNPANGGSVIISPSPNCNNATQYTSGTNVTLTATSNSGYSFSTWSGNATGSSNPLNIVMDGNKNIIANFAPLSRSVYLPFVSNNQISGSRGIYGRVTDGGIAAVGIYLELRFYNGSSYSTRASTMTTTDGRFSFTGVPSLNTGQRYYVRYQNSSYVPNRLTYWGTRVITSYTAGSEVAIGDFDIADVPLVSPASGASVTLPYTFHLTCTTLPITIHGGGLIHPWATSATTP